MSDLANLNANAPISPYGNPNAVNLGQLYYHGPNAIFPTPVPLNTAAPAIPGNQYVFSPTTAQQMATGSGYAQQYGQSLGSVPFPAQPLVVNYPVAPTTTGP